MVIDMVLVEILAAVLAVSLVSLIGVMTLSASKKLVGRMLPAMVSFATGTLLAAAFLDLIPEALDYGAPNVMLLTLFGIVSFFMLEKFIHWHHHHAAKDRHAFTYLNLIGDGFHNFIDGIVIAASFLSSPALGITTTMAIIFHEIPQEIGDFFLLIYGGFSRTKALAFFFLSHLEGALPYLLAYTAGHFVYIASADIIPQLVAQRGARVSAVQIASM